MHLIGAFLLAFNGIGSIILSHVDKIDLSSLYGFLAIIILGSSPKGCTTVLSKAGSNEITSASLCISFTLNADSNKILLNDSLFNSKQNVYNRYYKSFA